MGLAPRVYHASVAKSNFGVSFTSRAVILVLFLAIVNPRSLTHAESPQALTPEEVRIYRKAHTVVDWTAKEIRSQGELKRLQPSDSQRNLSVILQKAGERVEALLNNFPNITATELVQSETFREQGNPLALNFTGKFRYLLVRGTAAGGEALHEYRTDDKGNPLDPADIQAVGLLTTGFTLSVLYFDAHNQGACRYRYFGRQMLGTRQTEVVGFAQTPGGNLVMAHFSVGDRTVQVLFQGLAWIDAGSHEVVRLQTDLLAPPPKVGLQRESTRIDFAPIHLADTSAAVWLPTRVWVDAWRNSVHCRTVHKYSDYKLFRVESRIKNPE